MAIDYFQVGQRLRAHRMGIGLSPDQAAKQLGISRAALYNYEKGEGPVKLETLERIAELLQTSLPSQQRGQRGLQKLRNALKRLEFYRTFALLVIVQGGPRDA